MAEKITVVDGALRVPDRVTIPFVEGDGIGPDIWRAAVRVFDAAVAQAYGGRRQIIWKEVLAGDKAHQQTGEWLPSETLDAMRDYVVSIKGPLTTPIGGGIRSLNVAIRKALDLYVCQRPTRWFEGVPSPVKHPEYVDMVIFRENTEDIYAGIEFEGGTGEAGKLARFLVAEMGVDHTFSENSGLGIKVMSEAGAKRLVRAAIEYAIDQGRPSVTLVHKGNIMKFTEGAFKQWGYEVAEQEYGAATYTWDRWELTKRQYGEERANAEMAEA